MEQPSLLALDEFVQIFLSTPASGGREWDSVVDGCESLETYCWLDLGAHCGFFEREASLKMVKIFSDKFSIAVRRVAEAGDFFSSRLMQGVQTALSSKDFLPGKKSSFSGTEQLHLWFQLAYLASARALQSLTIRSFDAALLLSNVKRWEDLLSRPPSPEEVVRCMGVGAKYDTWNDGHRNLAFAGYFELIKQFEMLIDFLPASNPSSAPNKDWDFFRSEIAEICSWRLDVRKQFVRDRFREATKVFGKNAILQMESEGIASPRSSFEEYGESLIKRLYLLTGYQFITTGA